MADKIIKRPDTPLAATPEANFSLTSRFSKVKNAQDKNEKAGSTPSGLNVSEGKATVKPYEKKFVPASKERGDASIVDGGGKTIKTSISGSQKSREDLRREYVKDSTDTMQRREKNANYYNVTSGSKKNLTAADKKDLLKLGKAKLS
jgi:hypothetical protein